MKCKSVKVVVYTIVLLFSIQTFGQDLRPEIKKIAKSMASGAQLEGRYIGIGGMPSNQYSKYKKLKKLATEKELLTLLQHESSIVKGYSAWALVDRKYTDLESIFSTFLNTLETVQSQSGCVVSEDLLAWELYSKVLYPSGKKMLTNKDKKYYIEQLQKLDHIILRKRAYSSLLRLALKNNQANPENYDIIKTLALEDNHVEALTELAKYKNEQDIDAILERGTDAFYAISYFPNPKFWNF
ncbi:hypothetical protein [Kordia sp.]|uniref:hypothetical protein n=1 Tax=Kordia sp. TaxID=1965332 RepID=UPI0025C717E8|nr:hypothetical protein [Kordia sp.]MCH2195409.1 hypothetical protein [Kordia sp.]